MFSFQQVLTEVELSSTCRSALSKQRFKISCKISYVSRTDTTELPNKFHERCVSLQRHQIPVTVYLPVKTSDTHYQSRLASIAPLVLKLQRTPTDLQNRISRGSSEIKPFDDKLLLGCHLVSRPLVKGNEDTGVRGSQFSELTLSGISQSKE